MSETDRSEYVPESVPETVPNREKKIGNMETTVESTNLNELTNDKGCPVPPEHVRSYSECCDRYAKGEISDLDVIGEVIGTLKKLRSGNP